MVKHWGKMERVAVELPDRTAYLQGRGKKTWHEMTRGIGQRDDQWFIAVNDDGYICMCESDPDMVSLFNVDIWQIDSDKPRDDIFCQKWTGKEVVPYEHDPA